VVPGGLVMVVAISRWAVLLDGVLRLRMGEGDLEERWASPAARDLVLDVARRLEAVPELLGMGSHLLLVARRPS
jgi:hypothetical protein